MHDIDVLVTTEYAGFEITWLVECKYWKKSISKLHVLALRNIVEEVGADRGIILSESGFQSGAVNAARLTNIHIGSLADMSAKTSDQVYTMRLHDLFDRIEACRVRYWQLSKQDRIVYGLRPGVPGVGYSGDQVVSECADIVSKAFRGAYPFTCETAFRMLVPNLPAQMSSVKEVVDYVDLTIGDLERRLTICEEASK